MKKIYTTTNVIPLEGDTVLQQFPKFCELEIEEANEEYYNQYLSRYTENDAIAIANSIKNSMIAKLWEVCNRYQGDRIADMGIVKLGQKPGPNNTKALAILQWVENLWGLYYQKRFAISNCQIGKSLDTTIDLNGITYAIGIYDFNQMGDIPYSYYEAMME